MHYMQIVCTFSEILSITLRAYVNYMIIPCMNKVPCMILLCMSYRFWGVVLTVFLCASLMFAALLFLEVF